MNVTAVFNKEQYLAKPMFEKLSGFDWDQDIINI